METELDDIEKQLIYIQSTVSTIDLQLESIQPNIKYEPTESMKTLYPILGLIEPSLEEVLLALNTYLVGKKCVNEHLIITPPETLYFLFGSNPIPYYAVLNTFFKNSS
jgi:hypothetical protein